MVYKLLRQMFWIFYLSSRIKGSLDKHKTSCVFSRSTNFTGVCTEQIKVEHLFKGYAAHKQELTDEGDGCGEAGSNVSTQIVLHGEPQVFKLPLVEVRTGGGNVEHSCDTRCCKGVSARGVNGTAQKQEGQQLHWTILQVKKKPRNYHHDDCLISSKLPNSTRLCHILKVTILPDHMLVLSGPSPLALVPMQRGGSWQICDRALERPLKIPQIHLNGGHIVLVKLKLLPKSSWKM